MLSGHESHSNPKAWPRTQNGDVTDRVNREPKCRSLSLTVLFCVVARFTQAAEERRPRLGVCSSNLKHARLIGRLGDRGDQATFENTACAINPASGGKKKVQASLIKANLGLIKLTSNGNRTTETSDQAVTYATTVPIPAPDL
jgi:hypothetical protein